VPRPTGALAITTRAVIALVLLVGFFYVANALVAAGRSWFGPGGVALPALLTFGGIPLLFGLWLLIVTARSRGGATAPRWRRNAPVATLIALAITTGGLWATWLFMRDIIEVPLRLQVTARGFECGGRTSGMYSDAGWLPAPFFTTLPCGMTRGDYEVTVTSATHMLLSWRERR
jgi:hypothetical protein